jgi:hypothetical protein
MILRHLEYLTALARERHFARAAGRPIRNEYLIGDGGKLAGTGAVSYTLGR